MADVGLGESLAGVAFEDARAGDAVLRDNERRAWLVALLRLHAATHAGVMLIAACAYILARRRGSTAEKTAQTLNAAALVSGVLLSAAGLWLGVEAVMRLVSPEPVRFAEAAIITAIGLVASGLSALVLRGGHAHAHAAAGRHPAHGDGRDLNLWAAYLHMLADVVTSVLALAALLLGVVTGWSQLDAAVGFLNAAVVAGFSFRLFRAAFHALR